MGMRRWIFRDHAGVRIPWLPIAALLCFSGALAVRPNAKAQDFNEILSSNLHDLKSKNAFVRAQAAESLCNNSGPDSPDYNREQTRKAIPALIEALKDTDPTVRSYAALALGNIPRDMRAAVPALIDALQDKDRSVRENAIQSLGSIAQIPEMAVPALAACGESLDTCAKEL
ncbi:MAG: HEAT repeat domain-containing protein [Terracidiphilus sp.]